MANQDRVNFVWAESALTTIPPIPVSEVAYRDTKQTPEQMEVGQQYDTIYNSARHNQLLFLLTSVAKTLCENGIMPFLAGQEYAQYARCIFTDGKLYKASRAILANKKPYPIPGDGSGVWIAEETSENLVPNSRRVIAGKGLTGGGPLSSDVTLSVKVDGKTTQAAAGGAITVKDVAIGGDLRDLASARGQIGDNIRINTASDLNAYTKAGNWLFSDAAAGENFPNIGKGGELNCYVSTTAIFQFFTEFNNNRRYIRYGIPNSTWTNWIQFISVAQLGDGIRNTNGIISVPEYEGATASSAGTSGLVPPAAAGEQGHALTGGGDYKLFAPDGFGLGVGETFNVVSDLNAAIKNGWYSTRPDTANIPEAKGYGVCLVACCDENTIYHIFFGANVWIRQISHRQQLYETWHAVWNTATGDARYANSAGSAATANYANSAGSAATANKATGLAYTFTKNNSLALPPGGTWFVLNWWDGDGGTANGNWSGGQIVAGGSSLGVSNGAFALRVE